MRASPPQGSLWTMLELFQTEWCPGCRRVRRRLAELGIDFVMRQVPEDPADRDPLERATGVRTVPVLLLEDGSALHGAEPILDWLAELPSDACDSMPFWRERESLLAGVPMS
jgi:glutaredoxin 3